MIDFFKHNLDLSRMTWLSGLQEVFPVIDIYFTCSNPMLEKKIPGVIICQSQLDQFSKKPRCATRKGLIDCFLSNEHRASKTWTKIENFVSLYILLKRAKPTTTKAKIEEEGRLL